MLIFWLAVKSRSHVIAPQYANRQTPDYGQIPSPNRQSPSLIQPDLQQPLFPAAPRQAFTAFLQTVEGQAVGRIYSLKDNYLIGRGSTCQIQLSDRSISRQHACLRYAGGTWFIQDQQSVAGTFVNGRKASATSLKDGDEIEIGNTKFVFRG
jgi:pSer/pThr/pTyr-binding forkhead associated (FHA) protein